MKNAASHRLEQTLKHNWNLPTIFAALLGLSLIIFSLSDRPLQSSHTWEATPVVINFYNGGRSLVVYADGQVVGSDYRANFTPAYWRATIAPQEVCDLLFQIEAAGFFHYRQSSYRHPEVDDAGSVLFEVNAWESNTISAYAFHDAMAADWPNRAAPTLVDTYELLANFKPAGASPFQPESVVMFVTALPDESEAPVWPLTTPDLAALTAGLEAYYFVDIVLTGAEARAVFQLFIDSQEKYFSVGDRRYRVEAWPLLPAQRWVEQADQSKITAFDTTPTTSLTCDRQPLTPAAAPTALPLAHEPFTLWAPLTEALHYDLAGSGGDSHRHSALTAAPAGDFWYVDTGPFGAHPASDPQIVHVNAAGEDLARWDGDPTLRCDGLALAAMSDQTLFVANACTGLVTRYAADGTVLNEWPDIEPAGAALPNYVDIHLAGDEQSLFLADWNNNRVLQVDLEGQLLAEWSGADLEVGQVLAVAVAEDGTFFLVDQASGEIVVWSSDGAGQRWRLPVANAEPVDLAVDAARQIIYVAGSDDDLYVYNWDGAHLGRYPVYGSRHVNVGLDGAGRLYASTGYDKIYVLIPDQ